jgi:hypothetical protein
MPVPRLLRLPLVLMFLVFTGCDGTHTVGTITPQVQGDGCAVHPDAPSCAADPDNRCVWTANLRGCPAGQTCPSGWCTSAGDNSPPSGVMALCACPGALVCVEELGGPPVQGSGGGSPPLRCEPRITGCTPVGPCDCLGPYLDGCRPSDTVSGLCLCDNGIR